MGAGLAGARCCDAKPLQHTEGEAAGPIAGDLAQADLADLADHLPHLAPGRSGGWQAWAWRWLTALPPGWAVPVSNSAPTTRCGAGWST